MKVAYLGLGKMGAPMAHHLSEAGLQLYIYNRSQQKSEQWIQEHPQHQICFSAKEACKNVDAVILCVGNDNDVRELLFGEQGAAHSLEKGTIVIDHTTTSADLAREMHSKLDELQVDYVDAPVSGGEQGAINGQLTIMCGGDPFPAERAEKITQCYTKAFSHMGPIGCGQLTKMVNQISVAGLIQALAEGVHFAQQAGLDVEKVMNTLGGGAASSWQMINRHKTMNKDEYNHGFAVDHMRKDLGICLESARKIQANLPITALVDQFYSELQSQNMGQLDTSALLKRLQK
jgi:3-hydroxyisobutyrate dehydrogenase-like beta-hydroxyacid dehydrogenase